MSKFAPVKEQLDLIIRGTDEVIPIEELEQKISNYSPNLLEELTKGVSKSKILSSFGNPDRKGKFSNGDELWGFKNYTLKFDKNGKLKNWSKPFVN